MTVIEQEGLVPDTIGVVGKKTIRCTVATEFQSLYSMRNEWDHAAERLGGTIYMTFDWCATWWKYYGKGNQLRIFIFYCANAIVGIFPIYVTSFRLFPKSCKIARLVGSNIPPKVFNPPLDGRFAVEILNQLSQKVIQEEGCSMLSLGPISEFYGKELMHYAQQFDSAYCNSKIEGCGVHSIFHLPKDFAGYFEMLSKKERKNNKNRYDLSLITQELGATETVQSDAKFIEQEFSSFVTLHANEWIARGGTGHYGSWPKGAEFNREAIKAQAELGRVEFLSLTVQAQKAASIYGFYFGNVYFAELLGRDLDSKWDKYNLGRTILVRSVAQAIQKGAQFVDAGLGHYDYKECLSATEHNVFQLRFVAKDTTKMYQLRMLGRTRDLLRIGYHKIWYRRLRKYLPAKWRKPQALFWLRYDF